ncbi:MAG: sigma-54-dependent transcriptional regulator [Salibacteraceae bacterium]
MAAYRGKILVIDDDTDVLTSVKLLLKQHFEEVTTRSDPRALHELISKGGYDLVLLDMNFAKGEHDGRAGFYWLNRILEIDPDVMVVMMTAYGEIDLAVKAIKQGASDFVLKPWKNEKLMATLHAALRLGRSRLEVRRLRGTQQRLHQDLDQPFDQLIGQSPAFLRVMETVRKVARTDANVLILGENGTGKEVVARALHRQSLRQDKVFISVDLGAVHEHLFESELFGHVKGAFTDAREDKAGRFELASEGSLFLDEIGNLSVPLQAKLLAVLQNRVVNRIGSNRSQAIDIRLICATNMPLRQMVAENRFRQDLLYRINTVEILLPPLRERPEDIPELTQHFLETYCQKYHKSGLRLGAATLQKLVRYQWPGNIRELQHAVERAVLLAEGETLTGDDFFLHDALEPSAVSSDHTLNLEANERQLVSRALERSRGNISHAARELGITRAALYRRMEKHGL